MIATINIFGKGNWATKITSLLLPGEFIQYDEFDYTTASTRNTWVIAEESGQTRSTVASTLLTDVTYCTLFKGLDDLNGVTTGDGLVVGPGSLIRPTTVIGNHVYIGAGTIIDVGCTIGDNVTLGDHVTITANTIIADNRNVSSGCLI
jgi:UDP-3-O-[3-hydroxymyristoyl] glucosamine N-acyltransferase